MINNTLISIVLKKLMILPLVFLLGITLQAQTSTFSGTGNWSEAIRWDNGVPNSSTAVIIADGAQCTINMAAECLSLTFANSASATQITISGSNSLTVSGAVTFGNPSADTGDQTLAVGGGTLICNSLLMNDTGANNEDLVLSVSSGTVTISGDLTMNNANRANTIFTGSGNLTIGGNFTGGGFTCSTSTVTLNSASNQNISGYTFYNIVLNGGGTKTLLGTTTINAAGSITFNNGLLNLAGFDLVVTSTATFAGTPSAASMIDFTNGGRLQKTGGAVADFQRTYPVGSGSDYSPIDLTSVAASDANGTMYIKVVGSRHPLLNGSNNALTRYWDFNSTDMIFTSVTGSLTYSDNDVAGLITEANLIKTGRLNSGWTENQAGTGYDHGTNQITFTATSAIFGTWTLGEDAGCFDATLPDKYTVTNGNWNTTSVWNGGAVPTAGQSVAILHTITRNNAADINPGNLTIEASGILNLNNQSITVTGTSNIYGTINDGNNTGTNTFQGAVTIHSGGSLTTANNSAFVFEGGITNNGSFNKTGTGAVTFQTNPQSIEGTGTVTMNGVVTVTGIVLTNNATVVLTSAANPALTGTGSWVQGNGSSLTTAAQTINISTFNASAAVNTVIYNRNDVQTINTTNAYHHLIIEGGNTKTVSSLLTINGNFTFQNLLSAGVISTSTNNVVITGNVIVANSGFSASITQTTGTLTATNLTVNGGNTLNLNSNATFAEDITVTNNSTLSLNGSGGVAYNIAVRDIIVDLGSTINNGTPNLTNTLTLNRNATINGAFDLYYDANSISNLIVTSNIAHLFSGTPTAFQLNNLTLSASSNTTTAGFVFDVEGSVNIGAGSTFDAGLFNHTVYTNWVNSGTLTTTGTITFDGAAQNIGAEPNFHNLILQGSGTKTISGSLAIANDLTINAGITISTTTNHIVVTENVIAANTAAATFTQTSGTLTAKNLTVNGGNTLNLNSNATFSEDITVTNNSTLSLNSAGGAAFNIAARDVVVNNGSTLNNGAANYTNTLTLNRNATINGNFDLWLDATSRTNLVVNSNVAHAFSGTPTSFQLYNFTINATSNTTTAGFVFDIEGSVNIGAGSTFDAGTLSHTVLVDWTNTGTLTNAGTFTFDGAAQNIGVEPNFYNLILQGSGTKTISGSLAIANDLTINAGITISTTTNNIVVTENVIAANAAAATFTQTSGTLTAKNLTVNGSNTLNLNSNATFTEDITVTNNSTLSLNSAGGAAFNIAARDVVVNNGSTLNNGAANYTNTLTLNRNATINGTFDLWLDTDSRTNLVVNSDVAHAFSGTPTAFQLYNFTINATSNTTTAGFVFDIEGSVIIGAGSTFDAGALSHTVLVDWTNSGTLTTTGTITFDGGTQNIGAEPGFNHLTFSTAGTKTFTGNITLAGNLTISNATVNIANSTTNLTHVVNGNVTITSGSLNTNAANATHSFSVGGDLTVNGSLDFYNSVTQYANLIINNNIPHAISGTPATFEVYNLTLAASSNTTTIGFDILNTSTDYIQNDISIGNGATLDLNSRDVDVYGNINIAAGGTLEVDANSGLNFSSASKSIQNSGTLSIQGTAGNIATLTASAAGNRFYIDNLSGSSLLMKYYSIDYLTGNGITVASGATADGQADNFSYGTFGANSNSTQCLQLSGVNFATNNPITVTNPVFNTTSGYNVTRTSGTGVINLIDATGVRAGESFDNDNGNPGTLVNWTYPASTYFTIASGNFSNPAIWNADPSGHFTDATSVFQIMDGHTVTLDTDIDVLELIVGSGATGSLIIGNNTTARTLTTRESLTVQAGASLTVGTEATHILNIYGNLVNNGTANLRSSFTIKADVNFYGPSTKVNGTNTITFSSVTFKTGTTTTAHSSLDINWNLAIEDGATFNDGGLTHTVAGDWTETGTGTRTGTGTINFDETASTIKSTTAATTVDFYNVLCTGTGSVVFASDLNAFTTNITNNLTINDDKIVLLTDDAMNISGNITISSAARFTANTALVTFNGTSAQALNLNGYVTFYDITFSGASTKSVIGNIRTTRYFTINAGATVDGNGAHEIANNLTIDGTCAFSGSITMKGGNITSNNATLTFTHLADLNILGNINITTTTTLAVSLPGNVNIQSNYLIINSNTSLACTGTGTFNLAVGLSLYVRDDDGFPTGFTAYNLAQTSYVQYDRDFDQIIRGGSNITYGYLYIHNQVNGNSRSRTADGNLKVLSNLYFGDDPITLNLGSYNLNLTGNLSNTVIGTTVNSTGGTVTLEAEDAAQTMGVATYNLTNLEFTLAAPSTQRIKTITSGAILNLTGNFITSCGSSSGIILEVALNNNSITGTPQILNVGQYTRLSTTAPDFGTSVLNNFVTKNLVNGTIHFASTTATQTIPSGVTYGHIAFTGSQIKQAAGNLDINGNISVLANTPDFRADGYTINVAGNWLLGTANTTVFTSTDKVIFDGIEQSVSTSNFQNLEIANTGTDSIYGGNITIYGNFVIRNGANFAARNRSITIHGNWTVEATGEFTQDLGATVTFAGTTSDQTIQSNINSYFGNLTITKNNGAGNQTVTALTDIVVKNSLTLTTDRAIFDLDSHELKVGGNFNIYANQFIAYNSFIPGSGTVIFDGITGQYIRHYSAYPLTFHHLTFSTTTNKEFILLYNPAVIDATRMVVVTGNWTNNGQNVYAYNVGNGGNTYVNFEVAGNWVNNGTFYHLNAGTVTFNGTDQNIGTSDFWNVIFAGAGTKTLVGGDMTVKQNLTINDGVTLDVGELENNSILVNLNWDMSAAGAIFNARTGTVEFDGTGTITTGIIGENSNKNFYDVSFSGNVNLSGTLDVDNDFNILSGTFTTGSNEVYIGGNFKNEGTFTHTNNVSAHVIFNASGGTKTVDPGTGVNFRKLTIDATGGTIYELQNNFSLYSNYDFTINQGIFDLNGNTITVYDANTKIVVNVGGEFDIDAGASVIFTNNNQSIRNTGGIFKMVGVEGNYANLTRTGGSYYITQTTGTFHARHYRCEAIGAGANGAITISGGTLDATNNFSNGTFISGQSTATTTAYLDLNGLPINNVTNLTITDVTFNGGGTTNRNVKRNATPADPDNGYITFDNSIGSLTGATFELDDASASTGNVRWIVPAGYYWQGDISADWHTPGNWEGDVVPNDSSHFVFFDIGHYLGPNKVAQVSADTAICGRIVINDDGITGLGFSVTSGQDAYVFGDIIVSVGGVITISDPTSEILAYGDWTNSGTFTHNNGLVRFLGKKETSTITQASGSFYDVNFYSPTGNTFTLGSNLTIANDFTFIKGNFDVVTRDMNIGGDWFMKADSGPVFIPKTRIVTFDGADQSITNGTFYQFVTSGTGTKSVLSNIEINGNLTINASTTLEGGENEIYLAGNWINSGTFTQTGSGTVIFDGGNQQIDNTGSTTTQFNKITIAGTGTKTLYKAIKVYGDLLVNSGANLDVTTFQIDGGVAVNSLSNNGSIYLSGTNNFPASFESTTMASSSNVIYRYAGGDQVVVNNASWSYGNLYLRNNSGTIYNKVVEAGDLKVTGSLVIDQTDVVMDMATNSANLILTGNINLQTGGQQINWGTGTSKFTHIGGDFNFDADITTFNNIELYGLSPYSWKVMNNDLTITGNFTIKNDVYLVMDPWNQNLPKTITQTQPGKIFTLENNARVYVSTPSAVDVAMPKGFDSYVLNANSLVVFRSFDGVDQTLYTANNIVYGGVTFQNTKTVTADGVSSVKVNGNWNMGTCIFHDGGQSVLAGGGTITVNDYTPSTGVTFTLNGGNQLLYNNAAFPLRLENIIFAGVGSKTFGSNNTIYVSANLTVNSGITVSSTRPIIFSGTSWTNNGKFRNTSTLSISGTGAQNINSGATDAETYFTNIDVTGTNTVNFVTNGADINGTFTISGTATVNMGALTHTLAGTVTNIAGGTWNTSSANITFDGGNQNINSPAFTAQDVTINGTGTKRLFSNWDVNNLDIVASTLNNYNNTSAYYALTVRGNYTNTGTFTHNNQSSVYFYANNDVTINNGAGTFWIVDFGDDAGTAKSYTLTAPTSIILKTINLNEDAHVKLNGNTLRFGYNTATAKVFTVKGILDVNTNARLEFQNQGSVCTMNVDNAINPAKAVLRIVGTDNTNFATLTRNTTGGQIINIDHGTIEAKYYLIEYLANAGMNIQANATLHATNNFSNGTFSNINNVAGACYLNLEAGTYTGGDIVDVVFNISGTPVTGIFNVKRQVSSPDITFSGVISGNLGNYKYEKDELSSGPPAVLADATQGKLRWPGILETIWTGNQNTNWDEPLNWSDGVPTLGLDAIIPDATNDPVMNVDGECKKLRITNGILRLAGGFNITSLGDITIGEGTSVGQLLVLHNESVVVCGGSWTMGTNGIFAHGNSTVVFNTGSGSATISPLNSIFNNIEFNNSASTFSIAFHPTNLTLNVLGNFDITNGTVNLSTTNYVLNLGGNFNNQDTLIPGTGTVKFNKAGDQTITNGNFNKIEINGSGIKYTTGPCSMSGSTIILSTLQANAGSTIDFNGDVTVNASGTFNDGGESHTFSGVNWRGTGNYAGTGTITFDLTTANQNLYASKFYNLVIACTGRTFFLYGNISVENNLIVTNSVSVLNISTSQITNLNSLGTFQVDNNTTINITGTDNFPQNFLYVNLAATTTTQYNGSNQVIRGGANVKYGYISLVNASTKTLDGNIEILGNLTFSTSILDVSENNYSITISGNWNNNNVTGGTFIPRHGEVIFNGTSIRAINVSDNSTNPFYHLKVDKLGTSLNAPNNKDLLISGNLTITNGTYTTSGRTTTIGGDMYAENGAFSNSGTYILNKASGTARVKTNFNYNNNTNYLNNLTFNGGATYTLESDLAVYGNFYLNTGTLNANGYKVALGNATTDIVNIDGNYIAGAGGQLIAGYSTSVVVGATGSIELVGSGASPVIVTNNQYYGGRYAFTCNGTIKAENYQFNYMNASGIRVASTGIIDAINNFSNGTFTNGAYDGTFLKIENTQSFVNPNYIENVSFPTNPGGTGMQKNVEKTQNSGTIEFWEASGVFSGVTYEKDDFNRINWTGNIILTWNGSAGTDWNNAANWTANFGPSIVPTGNENVVIANVTNKPKITTFGQLTKNLTINTGSKLTIETPYDAGVADITVQGDFTVLGSGNIEIKTSNDFMEVQGSWTIPTTASYTNNGTVTFNGAGSAKIIDNGTKPFYNLIIDGTSLYSLGRATTITADLSIRNGASLDVSGANYAMAVGGNWLNEGSFVSQAGTVTLNAVSGPRTIDNNSSYFNNLTINAPGVVYSLDNHSININGNFNLNAGTFNHNQQIVNMGNGTGTDYLNVSGSGVYNIGANGILRLGTNANVNITSGGTFNAVGSDINNKAIITRQSSGNYVFTVANTGNFGARYYQFEYMNTAGIYLQSGAILNATNNFSDGVFSYGATGGTFLKLENTLPHDPEIIENVVFNTGPTYNVTRTTGTSVALFRDASGTMGYFTYENDAVMPADATTGLLQWSQLNSITWNGLGSDNSWHNPTNWLGGAIPTSTNIVTIVTSSNNPVIYEGGAEAKQLVVETGTILTINNQNLTVLEEIRYAGTITASGTPRISTGGSWTNASGTFNPGSSTVVLAANTGSYTITQGSSTFYSIELNSGATYSLTSNLTASKDITILNGTLNCVTYDIYVGGSWTKTGGTFTPGIRTVYFNGTGSRTINSGGTSFYNVSFTGNGTSLMSSNFSVTNLFTQSAGTIDLSPDGGTTSYNLTLGNRLNMTGGTLLGRSGTINVGENWSISGSGIFTAGASTVNMNNTSGTRTISTRSQAFNNLNINGAATFNLDGALIVNGNLAILAGTLSVTTLNWPITLRGNWTNNATFTPFTSFITFNGTSEQLVSGTGTNTYGGITVNNSSATGVRLASPVTVKNALTLTDGYLFTTSVNLLTLNDNGTATSGSNASFVDGPMVKIGNDAFTFPLGDSARWAPLAITAPSVVTDAFRAEYFGDLNAFVDYPCTNCDAGVEHVSRAEYWDITRTIGTSTPNVTMYFKDMAWSRITDLNDLIFAHYDGAEWVQMGTGHGVTDGVNMCHITGTGFTSYSPVLPGSESGNNPLPIELISFDAIQLESFVLLTWTTLTETNNNYFTIEKSIDGHTFKPIAVIKGAESSQIEKHYEFIDNSVTTGVYYYRLKQTDFNGNFTYSKTISIGVTNQMENNLNVYPNPSVNSNFNILYHDQKGSTVEIRIIDMLGKTLYVKEFILTDGNLLQNMENECPNLIPGTYYLILKSKYKVEKMQFNIAHY